MIRKTISCLAALGAAVAGFAVLGTPSIASAVAAQGAATLSVSSGTGSTNFNISLPAGAACSGSGSSNYRWDSYFVAAATDASTLTFNAGTIGNAPVGSYASQLTDISGNVLGTKNPSASPVGLISGITQVNLSSLAGAPVGAYKLGIFCANLGSSGALDAGHFWETKLTITNASTLAWVLGTAPAAPVLASPLTANDGSLAGSFTQATADPAVTGYTVTFHPASGPDLTASLGAGVTTFTKTGLANGTQYAVTIVATNTVNSSVASNSVNGTPNPLPYNAVTNLVATPATGAIALSFTGVSDHVPNSYQVAVTQASTPIAGSPFTVAFTSAGATETTTLSSLTAGLNYAITVTPSYTSPYSATGASTSAVPLAAQVLIQDITVTRPVGALVLTQVCAGSIAPTKLGVADPGFTQYPYPVNADQTSAAIYPTHCGLALGNAALLTTGAQAGQFFKATGAINAITVVDTRDTDGGWTVQGSVTNFTDGGSNSFSGNYLGWTPAVTTSTPASITGYTQVVSAGAAVTPAKLTGLNAAKKPLASAAAGHGLGIAVLAAPLTLLIPIEAISGNYSATLTFDVI